MKKSKIGGKNLRWRKLGRRKVPNFSFLPKVDQFEYLNAKPSKVQCDIFSAIFLTNVGHLQFRRNGTRLANFLPREFEENGGNLKLAPYASPGQKRITIFCGRINLFSEVEKRFFPLQIRRIKP
jgi:hypothetical protein